MGLLRDAVNSIGRAPDDPTSAFDKRHPNNRGPAEGFRMIFRIVRKDDPTVIVREHAMVLQPESYTRTPEARLSVHQTAGGHLVDLPRIDANGLVHYTMTGTTGLWPLGSPVAGAAQIPSLGDLFASASDALFGTGAEAAPPESKPDGMAALKDLREIFEEYLRPNPGGMPRDQVQLEFINPDEPIDGRDPSGDSAYIVVPARNAVETSRSARSPSLYRYTIRLTAYGRPNVKPSHKLAEDRKTKWWQDVLGIVNDLELFAFDTLFAQYQLFAAPLTRIVAKVGDVRRLVQGWAGGVSTFAAFHEKLLRDAIAEIEALTSDLSETLGVSAEQRLSPDAPLLRDLEGMRRDMARMANGIGADPSVTNRALGAEASEDPRPIPVAPEFAPETPRPLPEYPMERAQRADRLLPADAAEGRGLAARPGAQHGTRLVTVRFGDGLEDFVPAGWTKGHIVSLNNLRHPFVDGTRTNPGSPPLQGDPRVAYVGDTLLVPVATGTRSQVAGADASEASRARDPGATEAETLYGVDLYVNPETRALEIDPATGDVRMIGGVDNLLQALRHLLAIPVGSLHTAPSLGSYLAAEAEGRWATSLQTRLNAIAAARTLRQDHRVERVRSLRVHSLSGVTHVSAVLDAINGRPVGRVSLSV